VKCRRVVGSVLCAVVAGAVSLPAQASDTGPGLPFESTWTEGVCSVAARTADSTNCSVVGRASAVTGAVSAQTHLVSPAGGTAAWSADAMSTGQVAARYHLAQPVRDLDFAVTVRVNQARVALGAGASGRAAYYVDPTLIRHAQVDVSAFALHSACSDCGSGDDFTVLSTWTPGTTLTTSGEDVVLHVTMSMKGGKDLPPGDVTVRAGVNAPVAQSNAWGDDSASIDAVVTKIVLS
jgi:hypothetical protein